MLFGDALPSVQRCQIKVATSCPAFVSQGVVKCAGSWSHKRHKRVCVSQEAGVTH